MGGSRQEDVAIVGSQVRSELDDPGQVETAVSEHDQEDGVLTGRAGRIDAKVGFGLRKAEYLRTIREHGRRGFGGVKPSGVHLADVRDEISFDATRVVEQLREPTQQLVVRKRMERPFFYHTDNMGPGFSTSWEAATDAQTTGLLEKSAGVSRVAWRPSRGA
jgi:hypothetical protein